MSFSSERKVGAVRKEKRCDACGKMVEIGQPAIKWAGTTDGDFGTLVYHVDCRAAELALNKLHGTWSNDDWISLADFDFEDGDWLLAEYPDVAARKGITVERLAEWAEQRRKIWEHNAAKGKKS
jgi:hypothetical protein